MMRWVALILCVGVAGCALSPGQLDTITAKEIKHGACLQVIIVGDPKAGESNATATIPVSALPAGLGIRSSAVGETTPSGVTQTCTVTTRNDNNNGGLQ